MDQFRSTKSFLQTHRQSCCRPKKLGEQRRAFQIKRRKRLFRRVSFACPSRKRVLVKLGFFCHNNNDDDYGRRSRSEDEKDKLKIVWEMYFLGIPNEWGQLYPI